MAKQFTLGKSERLKSRKLTDELFDSGKRFTVGSFRIQYVIHVSDKSVLQFGVGVGVKQFSKAVERNRVKRLVREAYRLQKPAIQTQLEEKRLSVILFFIYTGKELPSYQEVYENIGNCLSRLSRLIQEYK